MKIALLRFVVAGILIIGGLAGCGGGGGGGTPPATNNPPVADAGANQVVAPGDTVTLDASNCNDPDGQTLTYTWEQVSGPTVTLSAASAKIVTFIAPDVADVEQIIFKITVSDGIATITDEVTILCKNTTAALPPIADAGADKTVNVGVAVTLDGSGSIDAGGALLTYSWVQIGGKAVALSSASTATATFTAPSVPADEVLSFELTVSNGKQSAVDAVNVAVQADPNSFTPKADAGADQTVISGFLVTLDGSASSDPNNEPLTYSWVQVSGSTVTLTGANTAKASFTAPDVTVAEPLIFELTVSNTLYSHSARTQVTVNPVPDTAPPSVSTTPPNGATGVDRSVVISAVFSEDVKLANSSTFTLHAGATLVDGSVAYDEAVRTATFTPAAPLAANTQYTVTLTSGITDLTGNPLAATSWSFTTTTDNSPVAKAGADQHVSLPALFTTVTLDGSWSSDVETPKASLLYSWKQTAGSAVTVTGANNVIASFHAPNKVETLTFELSVTDGDGHVSKDTVNVTVLEDVLHAVFVSTTGSDTNSGVMKAPVKTLAYAIKLAQATTPRSDVYIAAGKYYSTSSVSMSDGVSLYGGFIEKVWTRTASAPTMISGSSTMLSATSITNSTVVDGLTVESASGVAGAGGNSTAVYVRSSTSALKITNNTIKAGKGGTGGLSATGGSGQNGGNGAVGDNGNNDTPRTNSGGSGGSSSCYGGGKGGSGGFDIVWGSDGTKGSGTYGGAGGEGGYAGNPGHNGGTGSSGANDTTVGAVGAGGNSTGTVNTTTHLWAPSNGTAGGRGGHGYGGGGGGGGGGQLAACSLFGCIPGTGAGGGGGGGAGCGGYGGAGGGGGGGSFGIFLSASSPAISGNIITTGGGGTGGNAGSGGAGGSGGTCSGGEVGCGGAGGKGGNGGAGGHGGGGGGVSYGIYRAETSVPTISGNTYSIGLGGVGGTGGSNGAVGTSGNVY